MLLYKKSIELYADREYAGTSIRFKRCKDYVAAMQDKEQLYVTGKGMVNIKGKKLRAYFSK